MILMLQALTSAKTGDKHCFSVQASVHTRGTADSSQKTGKSSIRGGMMQIFCETARYKGLRVAIRRCCHDVVKLTPSLEEELAKVGQNVC